MLQKYKKNVVTLLKLQFQIACLYQLCTFLRHCTNTYVLLFKCCGFSQHNGINIYSIYIYSYLENDEWIMCEYLSQQTYRIIT